MTPEHGEGEQQLESFETCLLRTFPPFAVVARASANAPLRCLRRDPDAVPGDRCGRLTVSAIGNEPPPICDALDGSYSCTRPAYSCTYLAILSTSGTRTPDMILPDAAL